MLFMAIFTYDPEKREAVIKRRAEKGLLTTAKVIGEWGAIAGCRVFRVVEADDPMVLLAASMAWGDLGQVEIIPIMTSEDIIKAAASKK